MSAEEIAGKLEQILKELRQVNEMAKNSNIYVVERVSKHLISHVQTLLEGLKRDEAGYSI
ncbi:MAG TPA: hypothetical protein EYH45_03490 [Candidatus Caldiarchaeum subterraneum]|uniref:Uncharacterized protein n=1 Tax=Caldiarchaeum subterraneum TaxID=311458 RepID=A0A832ZVT2_CALS0|nr:hypothetical protein [Aigarchaeota archaeon]HIQ29608.1 hypothetical protein [Candidatus Caldarchaeum subterraneum]